MSYQRLLLIGALGVAGLAASCANILGIEDADCDPQYPDCAPNGAGGTAPIGNSQTTPNLLPSAGNGGAGAPPVSNVPTAGAGGGGTAPVVQGAGGVGGGGSSSTAAAGSAGAAAPSGGAGGAGSMPVDPIIQRASPLCREYCDTVLAACPPPNQQYASPQTCLRVCEMLDAGTPGSNLGNNVECRLGRARLAASTGEAGNYCFTAGPGGGNTCGSDCDGYCTVMLETCDEYTNFLQCTSDCSILPNTAQSAVVQTYNVAMQAGNTVQCRLFHVSASTIDPVLHCPHAAGEMPCL